MTSSPLNHAAESFLAISAIENWASDRRAAELFEAALLSLKADLPSLPLETFGEPLGLRQLFVQFQFSCAGLPSAVRGTRVGRITKRGGHLSAYVEITAKELHGLTRANAVLHLAAKLLQTLDEVRSSLSTRIPHRLDAVLSHLSGLTSRAM